VFYQRDPEASAEKYTLMTQYTLQPTEQVMNEFFQNPLIKVALGIYWGYSGVPLSQLPFIDYATLYFAYLQWKPGYIRHGSQAMSNALLEYILANGGQACFNCGAKRILVDDGRVA
jgi:prolycopene isomerase